MKPIPLVATVILTGFIMLILLGILDMSTILARSEGFTEEDLEKIIAELKTPVLSEDYGSIEWVDLFYLYAEQRPEDLPITATEIGCIIARDIKSDFVANGNFDHGASLNPLKLGSITEKLISYKRFKIEYNGGFSTFSSLDNDQKKLVAERCREDIGDSGSSMAGFNDCAGELSEKCITEMLSHLRYANGQDFCGGTYVINGEDTVFGNQCNNCKDSCPEEDKIDKFEAVGSENMEKTTSLKFGKDPYLTKDELEENSAVPKLPNGNIAPEYVYIITWDSKNKQYNIRILKIPVPSDYGEASPETIADDIHKLLSVQIPHEEIYDKIEIQDSTYFYYSTLDDEYLQKVKVYQRSRDEGYLIPELRLMKNITFTASENMIFADFLENSIPNKWTRRFSSCATAGMCLDPEEKIQNIFWLQYGRQGKFDAVEGVLGSIGAGDGSEGVEAYGETCDRKTSEDLLTGFFGNKICYPVGNRNHEKISDINSMDNFYIYSIYDPNNPEEKLEEGHTYNILINNWFYNHRDKGPGWTSVKTNNKFVDVSGANQERVLQSIQDVSIIIIDISERIGNILPDEEQATLNENIKTCTDAGGIDVIENDIYYCSIGGERCLLEEFVINSKCPTN